MLTLLLTAILFYLTRKIIRSDSTATRPDTQTDTHTRYLSRDTFDETPYLDPEMVMAIDLAKLLP